MFQVRRICFTNARQSGGACGIFVASENVRGPLAEFWPIDISSLTLQRIPWDILKDHFEYRCICSSVVNTTFGINLVLIHENSRQIHKTVREYCEENVNKFLNIHGPGSRSLSEAGSVTNHTTRRPFCMGSTCECMRVAIINGIALFSGTDALSVANIGTIPDSRFGIAEDVLQRLSGRYRLQKVQTYAETLMNWLFEQRSGIFIVIVRGRDSVGEDIEHVVVVSFDDGVILDGLSERAIVLHPRNLYACVGTSVFVEIKDMRRLVYLPESKGRKDDRKRKRAKKNVDTEKKEKQKNIAVAKKILKGIRENMAENI